MGDPSLAVTVVEAIEKHTGAKRGYRRAHARGLVCSGVFRATAEARSLTRAEHFQGADVPCLVRLSNAAANPFAADRESDRAGKVMGLAVRFQLASGGASTWAAASLPSFVARTPEQFIRLTRAQDPSFFGRPNPIKIVAYLLSCPSAFPAIKAITGMRPTPSFANMGFNGIHTYFAVDAGGGRRPFRYRWIPRAGAASLTAAEASRLPPLYLLDELRARLARGAIEWDLSFQFPAAGDPLDDATRAWPETRPTSRVGTLTVTKVEGDQAATEGLVFDPTNVAPGIELSNDPLLRFRADAYSESYRRRAQEKRDAPAPGDLGQ
jgi:catalase